MELRRETLRGRIRHPAHGFEPAETRVEVRWDPLTGQTSRLVTGANLMPRADFDLEALAAETRMSCPFCSERIESATPRFGPELVPDGRIRRGEAILFPNVLAYAKYSAVSVYSPARHFLPLEQLTAKLVADNLTAQVAFAAAVVRADPGARWASVNANHMLPSGSSLFHPHLQGSVDPAPTTMQRLLAEVPPSGFRAYLDAERRDGARYLGSTGRVEWLASFAPMAPGELRAFVTGVSSPAELDASYAAELGHGLATALALYAELGFTSFNMAVYGAPPGTPGYLLNLRLVARSSLKPLYRSDATYLERLHWEAAVDVMPEELAARAGDRFRA